MEMKRSYYEDVRLIASPTVGFWLSVLLLSLCVLPLAADGYTIYVVNFMAVHALIAVGLNILVGHTGQISLGHAGFVAIGAYATVLLMTHLSWPFLAALVAAGAVAAGFGYLLGLPALRLEGPYLAIATLGFGMAVTQVIGRWSVFGGRMGISLPSDLAGGALLDDRLLYATLMPVVVLLTWAARNLLQSRVGRAFRAIRDSEIAARALGVDVTHFKMLSFAVSAFYAGVGGGLLAAVVGYINPEQFTLMLSVLLVTMITNGGLGSISGSIVGASIVSLMMLKSDVLTQLPLLGPSLGLVSEKLGLVGGPAHVSWIVIGLVLIVIVVAEPLGLYGLWKRTQRYWSDWPF